MRVLGLTGGMASGKSTIAALFRRAGVAVFDADACVHALQAPGGKALPLIDALFPDVVRNGRLDRAALRACLLRHPEALSRLEGVMHPLVRREELRFLKRCRAQGRALCVLDIPLLLETGADRFCDLIVVAHAPFRTRLSRIRKRRGLSASQAERLLSRQLSDDERRRRADIVIRTGLSRGQTARQVRTLIHHLRENT